MKTIIAIIGLISALTVGAAETNVTVTVTLTKEQHGYLTDAAARTNATAGQMATAIAKRALVEAASNERARQEREGLEKFRKLTDAEKAEVLRLLK